MPDENKLNPCCSIDKVTAVTCRTDNHAHATTTAPRPVAARVRRDYKCDFPGDPPPSTPPATHAAFASRTLMKTTQQYTALCFVDKYHKKLVNFMGQYYFFSLLCALWNIRLSSLRPPPSRPPLLSPFWLLVTGYVVIVSEVIKQTFINIQLR